MRPVWNEYKLICILCASILSQLKTDMTLQCAHMCEWVILFVCLFYVDSHPRTLSMLWWCFVCCACQFKVNHTHTHTEKINKFTFCSLLSFQHMRFSHLLHLYVNAFSYFDFVLWRSNFWLIIMCVHTTQYKVIFVSIVANGCLAIFPVFSCSFPFYVAVCRRLHQLKCGLWPQINGTMLLLRACFSFFSRLLFDYN